MGFDRFHVCGYSLTLSNASETSGVGREFLTIIPKFRKRRKLFLSLVHVLHKT